MPETLPRIPSREDLRKVLEGENDNKGAAPPPTPARDADDETDNDHE